MNNEWILPIIGFFIFLNVFIGFFMIYKRFSRPEPGTKKH